MSTIMGYFSRLAEAEMYSLTKMHNTGTFHMWCVVTTTAPGRSTCWAIVAAIASFLLVFLQVFVLTAVMYESSHPACTAHGSCAQGTFCSASLSFNWARCEDCSFLSTALFDARAPIWEPNATVCEGVLQGIGGWDLEDSDYTITRLSDPARRLPGGGFKPYDMRDACLAWAHCDEFNLWADQCEHIMIKHEQMHWTVAVLIVVLSILVAHPLVHDIDQAICEEALLDHQVIVVGGFDRLGLLLVQIVRMSLRARRFFLPVTTSMAALCVVLNSQMTATDIILNLLAVTFITEADDMAASLFLFPSARASADVLITNIMSGPKVVLLPWAEARVRGFLCILIVVVPSLAPNTVLGRNLQVMDGGGCNRLVALIGQEISHLPIDLAFLQFCVEVRTFCAVKAAAAGNDAQRPYVHQRLSWKILRSALAHALEDTFYTSTGIVAGLASFHSMIVFLTPGYDPAYVAMVPTTVIACLCPVLQAVLPWKWYAPQALSRSHVESDEAKVPSTSQVVVPTSQTALTTAAQPQTTDPMHLMSSVLSELQSLREEVAVLREERALRDVQPSLQHYGVVRDEHGSVVGACEVQLTAAEMAHADEDVIRVQPT